MQNKFFRTISTLAVIIVVLSIVGWVQVPQVAQAVPPAQEDPVGLSVEVTGPSSVAVDDTFTVDVVANNIPDPGIYGYQFVLNWDNTVFSPVGVTTNPDFPILAVTALGDTSYEIAASREGDVPDLTGPLTLVTLEIQANAVTDPESSLLYLNGVKLGRRGGVDVPVDSVVDLEVVVVEDGGGGPGDGDIAGNVQVEARAADNQAGHTVAALGTVEGPFEVLTESNGDFVINDAPADTYTVTADRAGFLVASCVDVVHAADALTSLAGVTLLAGDIVDDEAKAIDITDAVAIGSVFGSTAPDEVADLNVDGIVDILDLILMSVNFGQTSEANPWICQPS
jgi:hypothetical protein